MTSRLDDHLMQAAIELFGAPRDKAHGDDYTAWCERVKKTPLNWIVPHTIGWDQGSECSFTAHEMQPTTHMGLKGGVEPSLAPPMWSLESPGVRRLDGTPFTISYDASLLAGADSASVMPCTLFYGEVEMCPQRTLNHAKAIAETRAAELREMGLLD